MVATLELLDYHHWLIFAFALMILEVFIGTAFCLWISFAAIAVGLLLLLGPLVGFNPGWQLQLLIFSAAAVLSVYGWRRYHGDTPQQHNFLNQRGSEYVGRVYPVHTAIVGNRGKVNIDDTLWTVEGEDCAAGSKVKVIAVRNNALQVELVDSIA